MIAISFAQYLLRVEGIRLLTPRDARRTRTVLVYGIAQHDGKFYEFLILWQIDNGDGAADIITPGEMVLTMRSSAGDAAGMFRPSPVGSLSRGSGKQIGSASNFLVPRHAC